MSTERDKTSPNTENPGDIRHSLVDVAVNFFLNPEVINKPYAYKIAFLKKKGLSDAEIFIACKKAENDPKFKELQGNEFLKQPVLPTVPIYRSLLLWFKLKNIKNISASLILLGVALFGAHYVYKKYIEPLIFKPVPVSKKSFLEEQLSEITKSISLLEKNMSTLEKSMKKQGKKMDTFYKEQNSNGNPIRLALKEMKAEIATVKGSLMSRHQFPAYPPVTPTIPGWQLSTKKDANDTVKENAKMDENKDPNISKDSSKSEIQLEQNNEDTVKENSGAKETAKMDEHKDPNISKDSSKSEIQLEQNNEDTVKENSGAKETAKMDEYKDHNISKDSSKSEIQLEQNNEDTVKENSGAKETAKMDENKNHNISKDLSKSEIQLEQNNEDTVKENSGAKETAKMDEDKDHNISKDSSKSEIQLEQNDADTVKDSGDAAKRSCATVDLENNVSTQSVETKFSEELNDSSMPETISSVSKSS